MTTVHLTLPALECRGLSKQYGATRALQDVSLAIYRGQVTALAGANGAGKSTLIRLVTGVEQPDSGEFLRDGVSIRFASRHGATKAGVFCVFQDQPFVGTFPVYRQVYLGYEQHFGRWGFISDPAMRSSCQRLLEELGLSAISARDRMAKLSTAARELVALAGVVAASRLLEIEHPVILLDEPTSALSVEELGFLRQFLEELKFRSAILFVSHRLGEVLNWSDAIYVLRDGVKVDSMTRENMSRERIRQAMSGQDVPLPNQGDTPEAGRTTSSAPARPSSGKVRFAVTIGQADDGSTGYTFEVQPGEVVGFAGVEGSGKEHFLRVCAGVSDAGGGSAKAASRVTVDGTETRRELRSLLRAGVVYLSGERQRDGVFANLSVTENVSIGRRVFYGRMYVRKGAERARVEELVTTLAVKLTDVGAPIRSLSGGNQQKVLLGRCLELEPRLLLLDNVTRGVDVGAKEGIYSLLRSLAARGVSAVLASDDLEELARIADRVVVFKDGHPHEEFDNADKHLNHSQILAAMV